MGAKLSIINHILTNAHAPPKGKVLRVLDVGCQNLYLATAEQVESFLEQWKPSNDPLKVKEYAEMIAIGSEIDPLIGGINGAWLGDLLSKAGLDYLSYDIFEGYKTFIFDLNRDSVPRKHLGAFDVVLNCGTSEHVLGQYNCFKVIHDATNLGGVMYHEVPFTGYLDHGYLNYQPQLFIDLAKANGYEIIEASIGEPSGHEDAISRIVQPYQARGLNMGSADGAWKTSLIPTSGFSILLRKTIDAPFKVKLETSTTAGTVTQTIQGHYETGAGKQAAALLDTEHDLLMRLNDPQLSYDELMTFYRAFIAAFPGTEFPLELERKSLVIALERWPDRIDMQNRLVAVDELIAHKYPLLSYATAVKACNIKPAAEKAPAEKTPAKEAAVKKSAAKTVDELDYKEQQIRALPLGGERTDRIVTHFKAYFDAGLVRTFPADLEFEAITNVISKFGATPYLKLRRGHLLSNLTRIFDLSA